jgi:ethanolamine transporter EutH
MLTGIVTIQIRIIVGSLAIIASKITIVTKLQPFRIHE